MKRIGIDIDDTITHTNSFLIEEAFKYDKLIGGKGFKNKNAYNFTEMFYWTINDKINFFNYLKENELLINLNIREDFKNVLNDLSKIAEIYFISSRSEKSFKNAFKQTEKWLKDNNVNYKMLYTNVEDKSSILVSNKIDIFVDDIALNCEKALNRNIDTILMTTAYNKDCNLKKADNWYQILEYIRKCENEKSDN